MKCTNLQGALIAVVAAIGIVHCPALIPPSKLGKHTTRNSWTIPRWHSTSLCADAKAQHANDVKETFPYNWKDHWYALTFASYVPNPSESAETTPAAVFGHPLVLWRSQDNGVIHCADDVCPHRSSALSEGRVRDGRIECLYHGWQYDGQASQNSTQPAGRCVSIPQLASGAQIPKAACLRMRDCQIAEGIVWVWMGDSLPTKPPPQQDDHLDPITGQRDGFFINDFQMDLPYDHSYLVENILDPAHVSISHDRTTGGGRRERAEAYQMIVDPASIGSSGFTGRFRLESQQTKGDPFTEVKFEAPGIVRQKGFPRGTNNTLQFGAALHCMPLGLGRSRLLFRTYFGGLPLLQRIVIQCKPKFLRNLNGCKILEQDAGLIATQEDHFKRHPSKRLRDDFLLLESSDTFVKTYRKWLDKVGDGMPWFQGLARRSKDVDDHIPNRALPPSLDPSSHRIGQFQESRYHRHVRHCPVTRKSLQRIQKLKKIALTTIITSITLSCWVAACQTAEGSLPIFNRFLKGEYLLKKMLLPILPFSCLVTAALHRLEQCFFVSYNRNEELQAKKGTVMKVTGTQLLGHLFER